MWNLSYTACSFVCNKKFKNVEKADLWGEFLKSGHEKKMHNNFFSVLSEYCDLHNTLEDVSEAKRLYRMKVVDEGEKGNLYYILIEIESGRYGFKSEITDKDTQKLSYHQKETDAPLMKFYLTVLVPKPVSGKIVYKGFMFFQNYGQFGVKTDTIAGLKRYLSDLYDYTLWVGNISPEIFVDKVLKSDNIKKISFIRNNVSQDSADSVRFTFGKEQRIIEKIRFTNEFMGRLKAYLAGSNRIFEFENKEYEDVKVNVDIGGRPRIIGLNNIENVSVIESLPDDIKNSNGDIQTDRLVNIICVQTEEYLKKVIYCL